MPALPHASDPRLALSALALAGALCVGAHPGRAQDQVDPLLAARTLDPLELGRLVDRLGDDALLERVRSEDWAVAFVAIAACPTLRAPERALEPLAEIARGRDPDLAPLAARAMLGIARALDPTDLDAREVLAGDLAPARAAMQALADDPTARPDLRRIALLSIDALAALGAPAVRASH